jgi:Glycosyl hydrolase family 63 C-terminal domain
MTAADPFAEPGERLPELARGTLERNWREGERRGVRYAYTEPSPRRYPWQWYWDSCFVAIAWRRFDPQRSRAELQTLLAAAEPDGFIGHTIFWRTPVSWTRYVFYNVVSRDDPMTRTIQPPLLALAWRIAVGDPAQVPGIVAHHDWVERERDLDGDGLLWVLQPDETGLDSSPQFDPVWGRRAHGLPLFPLLVWRNRRLRFDIRAVRDAGGPILCGAMTNVLHGLSRLALGRPSITPALVDRLWDEDAGLFRDEAWPAIRGRAPVTWAALSPLALPDLPEAIGRRLVEEHLLDRDEFWLPVPPSSVSAREPAFSRKDTFLGLRRYWRGPTWINAAWLLWTGLVRLGYHDAAHELAARVVRVVEREGLREYYDPYTGAGMGAKDFAWSALALELLEPEPTDVAPLAGLQG